MQDPVRVMDLPNGLVFRFYDRTRHYYGGFYHVKVEACCELQVVPEIFSSTEDHSRAVAILGPVFNYSKVIERMGVPEPDILSVRDQLISRFAESSLTYISSPTFPSGVVRRELEKQHKKHPGIRFPY